MLCKNRPEGFGPHSDLSAPLPTTCFTDTILLPLPTYTLLLLLPITILLTTLLAKRTYNPSAAHTRINPSLTSEKRRWYTCGGTNYRGLSIGYRICVALYYIFVVANVLMQVLEIVRLAMIHHGIALLPFVLVGLLIAGSLHYFRGFSGLVLGYRWILLAFWAANMAMSIVKTVGLVYEGVDGREGSMYPVEDQITDTGVMALVYLLIAALEVGIWRSDARREREVENSVREGSLGSGVAALEDGLGRGASSGEGK